MKLTIIGIALVAVGLLSAPSENGLTPYEFETQKGFTRMPVSDSNQVTVEGANLGRFLFYDPILSKDSTISCASCHQQENAFADSGKRFSVGLNGPTDRNTPGLFNLAWYPSMFWDGRAASVEEQVFFPVRDHREMDLAWEEASERLERSPFYKPRFEVVFGKGKIDSVKVALVIAQFERTLISANSKLDQVVRQETKFTMQELRGLEVMNDQSMGNCFHCHPTDANLMASTFKFSNNGLEDISSADEFSDFGLGETTGNLSDRGKFKIPSLRNVALTAPYMHDGRFETLEEVVDFYSTGVHPSPNIDSKMALVDQGGVDLSEEDKAAVVAFLKCLTDSTFITNPEFSNPWLE